jgi:hypothetical protein
VSARRSAPAAEPPEPAQPDARVGRGAALGFLAMLPLFAAYEAGVAASGGARNLAEVVVALPVETFVEPVTLARRLGLAVAAAVAAWTVFHAELGLAPRVFRTALEGLLAAVVLGPLLLVLLAFAGGLDALRDVQMPLAPGPDLGRAALLAGGAAWEELVFRMGLQSLFFVALRPLLAYWIASDTAARWGAEVGSVAASALVFAAAHLAVFTQVLGPGGEPWHPGVFPWRVAAGILLSALFRWRGPGVAAWAHAFFNLALSIGAGPQVFL